MMNLKLYKKILLVLLIIIFVTIVSLATIFRKKYILFRLADESSLHYSSFYGAGDFVIKNPFRDRSIEEIVCKVLEAIRNQKENKCKMDLQKFFDNENNSLNKELPITLNRASDNPKETLKYYVIHDILQKDSQIIYVLHFKPYGKGCMVFNSENYKVKKFWVIF